MCTGKSSEKLPKHNGIGLISESLALNLAISVHQQISNCLLYYDANLKIFSAVRFGSFSPCIGPLSRIKMSSFLLSTRTEELEFTPKIITVLPNPSLGNEKFVLYQIQYHIQDTCICQY